MVSSVSTVETNCPGQSRPSRLSKVAFRRMVPVVVSTVLSITARVPVAVCDGSLSAKARTGSLLTALRRRMAARCCSGTLKPTKMGETRWITTSGTSLSFTRFPALTSRLPVRPLRGARIWQWLRSRRAFATAASSAASAALAVSMLAWVARAEAVAASAVDWAWSNCERGVRPPRFNSAWRWASPAANFAWASSRASEASACRICARSRTKAASAWRSASS